MQKELTLPEKDEEGERELSWLKVFEVRTPEDYSLLDNGCVAAKARQKKGEELFRQAIEEAYSHHKGLLAKLKGYTGPASEFLRLAKGKMDAFKQADELRRREEQRKLQEEADKLAEEQALEDAAAAEKAGDSQAAEAIISAPPRPVVVTVASSVPKSATVVRRIPDLEKIRAAVEKTNGAVTIPGVHVYQTWNFKVVESAKVPDHYRRAA